ncbi:MAG: Holliday junction branch migration protein RuvA [Candidatus Nanosyncoccaceae bacterium]|jgi:Holliday junction DNA helicase RuvA
MIARLRGRVIEKDLTRIVIDVAGVGYEVQMPLSDASELALKAEADVYTYFQVREQSQELYGFLTSASKALFQLLITVQGVGPKAALAILSIGQFENVRSAIARSDSKYIQQAHGVGKKTAERVCVDLSDKVGVPSIIGNEAIQTELDTSDEAVEALMALGYTATDAVNALAQVDSKLSIQERIKQALKGRK